MPRHSSVPPRLAAHLAATPHPSSSRHASPPSHRAAPNRISVAHGESDVFHNATSDTHQGLIQSSASNLEVFVPHCHY
ncbi:hypothetical protein ACS0TY_012690 [Phlomoides rotata]